MSPRFKFNLFLVVVLLAVAAEKYYEQPSKPNPVPDDPVVTTSADMLMKYDANGKRSLPDQGAMVDSSAFRDWLDKHHVNYRIVPSITTFNDDQPVFKKLDEQKRDSDNWLYFDNGRLRGKLSKPLPANEADAEKLIGGYVK